MRTAASNGTSTSQIRIMLRRMVPSSVHASVVISPARGLR